MQRSPLRTGTPLWSVMIWRDYVVKHLGDAQGVLVVDEAGILKEGRREASLGGLARQYSGPPGG